MRCIRFLAGFGALVAVLLVMSSCDATGRWGLAILAAVLLTGLAVERWLDGAGGRAALRRLGFGRPGGRAVLAATVVSGLVLLVYPLATALTGAPLSLRPDWPWLLLGIFAFHGLAEELVWRATRSAGCAPAGPSAPRCCGRCRWWRPCTCP